MTALQMMLREIAPSNLPSLTTGNRRIFFITIIAAAFRTLSFGLSVITSLTR